MLCNSILLFSSITDIYAKLNFELGYFKFSQKVFIISAYFNNFKMFVSNFLKVIQFYPNCKPYMYAVRTYFSMSFHFMPLFHCFLDQLSHSCTSGLLTVMCISDSNISPFRELLSPVFSRLTRSSQALLTGRDMHTLRR